MRHYAADKDPRFQLWRLLSDTTTLMSKVRQRELRKYKVSANTAAVLQCIMSLGNRATPAQIARWLIREPQSISGILNRIEKRGMITRSVDPHRKNVLRISLTEIGKLTYDQVSKRDSVHRMISYLSKDERQQLSRLLKKIQKELVGDANVDTQSAINSLAGFFNR